MKLFIIPPRCLSVLSVTLLVTTVVPSVQAQDETDSQAVVEGRVLDADTKEPLPGARVQATGTQEVNAQADGAGRYRLRLLPGAYRLHINEPGFTKWRSELVQLAAEEQVNIDLELSLNEALFMEETVVTTRFDMNSTAAQLEARRESMRVEDTLSAEQMSRSPDSNAGDSARRVPGASIVGGQLVVRGLGGRYTQVLLNGVHLPGADPDSLSAELDLVPTSMLQSMSISKTASADSPADFVGGSLRLRTKREAQEDELVLSISTGLDSQSAFVSQPADEGGSLDLVGFDDGTRALPDSAKNRAVDISREGYRSRDELDDVGRDFPNRWRVGQANGTPDLGLGLRISKPFKLFGKQGGVLLQSGYSHKQRRRVGRVRALRLGSSNDDDDELAIREDLRSIEGEQSAKISAFGASSLELSDTDRVSLVSLWNHSGTSTARVVDGWGENEGGDIEAWHLEYQQRDFGFAQLLFEHDEVASIPGLSLRWQLNGSYARRDTPDMRDLLRLRSEQFYTWLDVPGSAERLYSELVHRGAGAGFDAKLRVSDAFVIKSGALGSLGTREFRARRFGMDFIGDDTATRNLEPDVLFSPQEIGTEVRMTELTRDTDGYDGGQQLVAGYAMVESKLSSALRVSAGLRLEHFAQDITPASIRGQGEETARVDTDLLPSTSAALEFASDHFLRLGYAATVARPGLRELSPFLFQDYVRRRTVQGNPDLERTYVHNTDLRWEHLPTESGGQATGEVLAISLFYKYFSNPIESVIQDRQGNLSFENIDGASNLGAEFEARLGLGRLDDGMREFFVGGNFALLHSAADLSEEQRGKATSSSRPLAGQSPYVANLSLGFAPEDGLSVFAFYNVFGPRIVEVGKLGLPDVYEMPLHTLDLSLGVPITDSLRLSVSVQNLLQQSRELRQGDVAVREEQLGTAASAKISGSL